MVVVLKYIVVVVLKHIVVVLNTFLKRDFLNVFLTLLSSLSATGKVVSGIEIPFESAFTTDNYYVFMPPRFYRDFVYLPALFV